MACVQKYPVGCQWAASKPQEFAGHSSQNILPWLQARLATLEGTPVRVQVCGRALSNFKQKAYVPMQKNCKELSVVYASIIWS